MDNPRILVVEDEAITAMEIRNRLEKLQYNVIDTVLSGEEAISIVEKEKPDLILMDIILKGKLDGTEAAEIISTNYHVPVIFLTAHNDKKTFNRAKLSLPYGYLLKPFETRDLQIEIELALYRHNMELKISTAEKRYAALMENASCGICIYDRKGVLLEVNNTAATIFGDLKHSIIGKNFKNYIIPAEQEYAEVMLNKLVVEKHIGPNEGHILQPKGKVIDVEFSSACINLGDEEILFSILTDISENNKLRKQALLNDKLALVGSLSAGIIHEINNPLSWILANLSVLQTKFGKLNDYENKKLVADFQEITDETLQGAKRIQGIIQDLKGFARIDDAELVPVDMNQNITSVINIVSGESKGRVKIETDFQSDLPILLMSPSKLQQVFLNIVINAMQSFKNNNIKNNRIRITTKLIENTILIDIQDSGQGIPPENYSRIFEPFFTTKPAGTGTGLGLSICHDIIYNLGGEITFKSELGKGTIFSITFPIEIKTSNFDTKKLVDKENKQRPKILIISDDVLLLKNLKCLLFANYSITVLTSGREALELLSKNKEQYDVIITDVLMPDVSGSDLYRFIAGKKPGLEKRFIFMTGSQFSQIQSDFYNSISNPKLTKPIEQKELFMAIEKICLGTLKYESTK